MHVSAISEEAVWQHHALHVHVHMHVHVLQYCPSTDALVKSALVPGWSGYGVAAWAQKLDRKVRMLGTKCHACCTSLAPTICQPGR